jgi:hypothetical protein
VDFLADAETDYYNFQYCPRQNRTYIPSSAAKESRGDSVPLVKMTDRQPLLSKDFMATPELKHQKLRDRVDWASVDDQMFAARVRLIGVQLT